MQVFNCSYCGNLVFFNSVHCVHCGHTLAFVPDRMAMHAMEPVPESDGAPGIFTLLPASSSTLRYRQCFNYTQWNNCNFAVPEHSHNLQCVACRQTEKLPDLSSASNVAAWSQLEGAKRQLFYTLAQLGLQSVNDGPRPDPGPRYAFLADWPNGDPVMTGHANGTITINLAEANNAERIKRRVDLSEPYRTLLGHLRHESGHYYWDRLVADAGGQEAFRAVFGDERDDYKAALERHYARGEVNDWQAQHVTAYAASHPWEDWAETWAHYLHMIDLLETAASYDTALALPEPRAVRRPPVRIANPYDPVNGPDFATMVRQWSPLTLLLNSMNRSLGQEDAYPFAVSAGALKKLSFVHDIVARFHGANASHAEPIAAT